MSKKCQHMDFRNSSQNLKAIKRERDRRSHTNYKIKGTPTQISRQNERKISH